jgi:hypothetical protein
MRVLVACIKSDSKVGTLDTWREMKDLTLHYRYDANVFDALEDSINMENMMRLESFGLHSYKGVSLPNCVCEFQNLKILDFSHCSEVRELPIGSFPRLKVLILYHLKKLESLSGTFNVWNERSMSNLQDLTISSCPLLMKLPLRMRLLNLKVLEILYCDNLKELDIENGAFPMLEKLFLENLIKLESITRSSGVWNEEAISKLEKVRIRFCPMLRRLHMALKKLFKSNKICWEDEDKSIVFSDLFTE